MATQSADDESPRVRRGTRVSIGPADPPRSRDSAGPSDATTEGAAEGQNQSGGSVQFPTVTPPRRGRLRSDGGKKVAPREAQGAADMVCGVVETLGRLRYGPPAAMSADERTMISTGLKDSMASLPADVVKQVADISAPVMAATGLLLYFYRLAQLETRKRANSAEDARAAAVKSAERIMATPPASAPAPAPTSSTPPGGTNGTLTHQSTGQLGGIPAKDVILNMQERSGDL